MNVSFFAPALLILILNSQTAFAQVVIGGGGGGGGGGNTSSMPVPGVGSIVGPWAKHIWNGIIFGALDANDPSSRLQGEIEPFLSEGQRLDLYQELYLELYDIALEEVLKELETSGLTIEQRQSVIDERKRRSSLIPVLEKALGGLDISNLTAEQRQELVENIPPEIASLIARPAPSELQLAEFERRLEKEALQRARREVKILENIDYQNARLKSLIVLQIELELSFRKNNSKSNINFISEQLKINRKAQLEVKLLLNQLRSQLSSAPTSVSIANNIMNAS